MRVVNVNKKRMHFESKYEMARSQDRNTQRASRDNNNNEQGINPFSESFLRNVVKSFKYIFFLFLLTTS